jgi:outer membrane protein OmpA-like peptidoglycan-associated protein
MIAELALAGLLTIQAPPLEISVATVPPDSNVDLTLAPEGEVQLRRDATITRVRVEIDRAEILTNARRDLRAWVVWSVSPEGGFTNLGELEPDGRGARLETATGDTHLGILVTVEPHFRVESPGAHVIFRSVGARRSSTRIETVRVDRPVEDYGSLTLPPQGSVPPRVTQARMAVALAEAGATAETTPPPLRQARVALDSLEQMLRRETPRDVLLPYADEAIRFADQAVREARVLSDLNRMADANRRIVQLERDLEQARSEGERAASAGERASTRVTELIRELDAARTENRELTLERDSAVRDLRAAREEVERLQDPWPGLSRALVYGFGASQTPRGMVLTLSADAFRQNAPTPDTREWLARLVGVLEFSEVPEVWIEGHALGSNADAISLGRAEAVRDYLVGSGLPEPRIYARGLGDQNPIPGTDPDRPDPQSERIEIIVRQVGSL